MKLVTYLAIGLVSLLSTATFADEESWRGELYNILPNNTHTTEAYCKSHSLDTYKTNLQDQLTEVIADNGVKAKDIGSITSKEVGGIYFHTAVVIFSGKTEGKEWQEKAYFFYNSLTKQSPMQGIWYTKNCKGLYKSGPA